MKVHPTSSCNYFMWQKQPGMVLAIVMCPSVGHVINFLAFVISSSLHVPISASFVCFASQSVHLQLLAHVLYCHSKL